MLVTFRDIVGVIPKIMLSFGGLKTDQAEKPEEVRGQNTVGEKPPLHLQPRTVHKITEGLISSH